MSGALGPYGQPPGEYEIMPGTIFLQSVTIPLSHLSGFKLHISVYEDDADRLARLALPTLRVLHVHHKVVRDIAAYRRMQAGDQRGKFITIYPGPAERAQRVVDALDPGLHAHNFRRGPVPTTRQSNHQTAEIRVGDTGMISCYWTDDYVNV